MNPFKEGLLKYLTEEQLQKIQSKKVGIGGAGGLGSNVAMMLIRSGFENLELLDKDIVDSSNLNRQQYFINEIGLIKVDTLKERLLQINPDAEIAIHNIEWSEENAGEFFKNCEIIVEAFDSAENKKLFVEYSKEVFPFVICGNGMAGLLQEQPMKIKKLENVYFVGDGVTDTSDGHPPMAPRVTACAAAMAEIVLDLTLSE